MSQPTSTGFGTHLIGRTENALRALLERQLYGTGLTQPHWVTLTFSVTTDGTLSGPAFVERVGGTLKVDRATVQSLLDDLARARLVRAPVNGVVSPTKEGRTLWEAVRARTEALGHELWGDQSEADLATAGRVLAVILDRADAYLAS